MPNRTRALILFASICLLLGAKTGVTIWQSQTDASQPELGTAMNKAAVAQQSTESSPEPTITNINIENGLALLTDQLIPQAEAAPNNPPSAYDDETLITLRKQKAALDARAKKLDKRENAIAEAEEKVKRRISELEQLEASIQQRLRDEQGIKNKKIKRLTAVFEGMKPDKAAAVVSRMELATVVRIFSLMNEKKVGKILSFLPPEKAVTISQALTSKISSVK